MKIKLLVLSIAAASLVGCGAYTAERSDTHDLPFPRMIEDQDYGEHHVGALDSQIIVAEASDVPFFRPIDDADYEEHNVGALESSITVADASDEMSDVPYDNSETPNWREHIGAVTFTIVTV